MLTINRPTWRDYLLVFCFGMLLFGYAGFSGRPLTMHEARLPQVAREMKVHHNWLIPQSGGRPWLERPPLPHWFVVTAMAITGHTDSVWVVRLPSAICGALTAVLAVYMAGAMFGRVTGTVSGLLLCTCVEFYQYASLAEDDIYLGLLVAACMALVVRREFARQKPDLTRERFFGNRSWELWAFFILLGITNIAKGPLLGMIVVAPAIGIWCLWQATEVAGVVASCELSVASEEESVASPLATRNSQLFFRYIWAWGWLLAIVIGLAWPLWAYHKVPDVLANWKYDYLGRMSGAYSDIDQPPWYYLKVLPGEVAPWTLLCIFGLLVVNHRLRGDADEAGRSAIHFIVCWAIVPVLVLSIPAGKHHHYLIPALAPWAMLGAIGAVWIAQHFFTGRRSTARWTDPFVGLTIVALPLAVALAWFHTKLPAPPLAVGVAMAAIIVGVFVLWLGFRRGSGRLTLLAILGILAITYNWIETYLAARTDHTVYDTAFLHRTRAEVTASTPLYITATLGNIGNLDFFRIQFYSRPSARLIQNLSFLRAKSITAPVVYVICRQRDRHKLDELGTTQIIDQSVRSHEIPSKAGRFTLFRLTFKPDLKRYPMPAYISSLQAMERAPGPWCGGPL